ncbi:MAG: OprD family outer membrane porin [Sulfurimonas sp.]
MKKVVAGTAVLMIMSIGIYANETMNQAIEAQKRAETFSFIKEVNGYIRAGYQNTDIAGDTDYTDTALGGKLHIETASWNGISAGASFYTTNVAGNDEREGIPFFDADNDSYSILGEAYLKGQWGNTLVKAGRQEIDTPFADTDDIGMVPNTFEAAVLVNTDIKDTTIVLAHIEKWAGVDVSHDPAEFERLNGDDGVQTLGITYEGDEGLMLSGWYYHGDTLVDISYIEAGYEAHLDGITLGLGGQYAQQDWESGVATEIMGASLSLGIDAAGLTLGAACNKADDNGADNGFGGGPFFTSAEHLTLAEAGADGEALIYSAEWDAGAAGLEGLTLGVGHLTLEDSTGTEATELDLTAGYAFNDALGMDVIYSDIDDEINGDDFTNLRIFVNYTF